MSDREFEDFYELLQVSPSAEPETIHRVYRLLAQRWHPDNHSTGDVTRFRAIHAAYIVLSDPEKRAQYDIHHSEQRQARWQRVCSTTQGADDFEREQIVRLTVLEILYAQRRTSMNNPGIFMMDLEDLLGTAREHIEFTLWYLVQKQLVQRTDNSRVAITADGVDYLESSQRETVQRRRLSGATVAA
jgi:curved DNA-binding protein CbpA